MGLWSSLAWPIPSLTGEFPKLLPDPDHMCIGKSHDPACYGLPAVLAIACGGGLVPSQPQFLQVLGEFRGPAWLSLPQPQDSL